MVQGVLLYISDWEEGIKDSASINTNFSLIRI